MKIKQNLHTHSHNSCDSACSDIGDLISEMTDFGITDYGLTDHIHTQYNLPDLVNSRTDFLAHNPPPCFHFGVEASVMDLRECERVAAGDIATHPTYGFRQMKDFTGKMSLGLNEQNMRELGIEYVVGGIHWPLTTSMDRRELIDNYFNQTLFLINHPLVDILAHPWDSVERAVAGWYQCMDDDHVDQSIFKEIPEEYNQRVGEALVAQGTLAEVNILTLTSNGPIVKDYILSLFCRWKAQGVKFSCAADLHGAHFEKKRFEQMEQWLTEYGFTEDDFALPRFRTY